MTTPFNNRQNAPIVSASIAVGKSVLQTVYGENKEGAALFFQIFDKATAPDPGDVAVYSWSMPTDAQFNANMPGPTAAALIGQAFVLGIAFGWSSTDETYTPAAVGGKWWATGQVVA